MSQCIPYLEVYLGLVEVEHETGVIDVQSLLWFQNAWLKLWGVHRERLSACRTQETQQEEADEGCAGHGLAVWRVCKVCREYRESAGVVQCAECRSSWVDKATIWQCMSRDR